MKIISTALLLLCTLMAVPVFSYYFGTAPGPPEWAALYTLMKIAAAFTMYAFVAGELTNNNSQVDKFWSVLPIVYAWVVAAHSGFTPRLVVMSTLVTVWGLRLTVNFALKGAYSLKFWAGEEDYRWHVLRQKPEFRPRWKWTLFNLFFICGYQNMLILLITLPTIIALQYGQIPLGALDYTITGLMFGFILLETLADWQQWKFQSRKHGRIKAGMPLTGDDKKGFLDKGLWALSRHPNYFAEQAIWICFYFFSVAASGQWLNWSVCGALLLMVLFQGSANFSEEISAGKYPQYAEYQKRVRRFLPLGKR